MYEQKWVQVFSWIQQLNPPNNPPSPPLHMACCHPHDPQLCGPRMIWPPELWGMWLRRNLPRRQAAVDNFCGGEEAEQPDGGRRMPRGRKTWWPPPVNCGGRNAGEEEKAPTPAGNPHSYCTFFFIRQTQGIHRFDSQILMILGILLKTYLGQWWNANLMWKCTALQRG